MLIMGVAYKFNELVVCLPRPMLHRHCLEYATDVLKLDGYIASQDSNQGFYTQSGKFVDKREAFYIAKARDQLIDPNQKEQILLIENLK